MLSRPQMYWTLSLLVISFSCWSSIVMVACSDLFVNVLDCIFTLMWVLYLRDTRDLEGRNYSPQNLSIPHFKTCSIFSLSLDFLWYRGYICYLVQCSLPTLEGTLSHTFHPACKGIGSLLSCMMNKLSFYGFIRNFCIHALLNFQERTRCSIRKVISVWMSSVTQYSS